MEVKEIIKDISNEFHEKKNSHIFLVETNNIEKCFNDIKTIINDVLNNKKLASQVNNESYLEHIIIRPDGKEIKKDQIKMLQDRIKIKPILGEKLFYTILSADLMNEQSANKMLKTIEEPSDDVVGFLIVKNIDKMLPTVCSRCKKVYLIYPDNEDKPLNEDIINASSTIISCFENKKYLSLYKYKKNNEFLKDNFIDIIYNIKNLYNDVLYNNLNKNYDNIYQLIINNNREILLKKTKCLNKLINKYTMNMNIELLLDKLYFELCG